MRCGTTCFRGTACFPRLKGRAPLGATLSLTITAIGSDALYLLALRRSLGVRGAKPPGSVVDFKIDHPICIPQPHHHTYIILYSVKQLTQTDCVDSEYEVRSKKY